MASTPMEKTQALPSLEMTAVFEKYICENCGTRHEPPLCPCPKCTKRGHPMNLCPMDGVPESVIDPPSRSGSTVREWSLCIFCNTRHQGECPCQYCNGLGHVVINCQEYKMKTKQKSRAESEPRKRGRMQITPSRETTKKTNFILCGKFSTTHHIKEQCFTRDADQSMHCPSCAGMTRNHLTGCKESRSLKELYYTCRKLGHSSQNCLKCGYCREYGHETENCMKKQDQCQKCGSNKHQTEFCRRHKRFLFRN